MPQALFWLAITLIGSGSALIVSANKQTTTPPATEQVVTFDIQSFLLTIGIVGVIALVAYLIFGRKGKK